MFPDLLVLQAKEPSRPILEDLVIAGGFAFRQPAEGPVGGLVVGTEEPGHEGLDIVLQPTYRSWPGPTDYTAWKKLLSDALQDDSLALAGYEGCTRLHAVADTRSSQKFYAPWLANPYVATPVMNLLVNHFRDRVIALAERRGLKLRQVPPWPRKKKYAIVLSHDVDLVSRYSWKSALIFLKIALIGKGKDNRGISLHRRLVNLAKAGIQGWGILWEQLWWKEESPRELSSWSTLEQSRGLRSTFFIAPYPDKADRDPPYEERTRFKFEGRRLDLIEWARWMIANGWEIGIHGSLLSSTSVTILEQEAQLVRKVINEDSIGGRQHLLSYVVGQTGDIHAEANLIYDSSLGYDEILGFRNAAALPFYPREAGSNRQSVLQLPLVLHDTAFLIQKYDYARALSSCLTLLEKIKETEGCGVLLFHPISANVKKCELGFKVYQSVLDHLSRDETVWLVTGKELWRWWTYRSLFCRGLLESEQAFESASIRG
jgi:hypothetical protein